MRNPGCFLLHVAKVVRTQSSCGVCFNEKLSALCFSCSCIDLFRHTIHHTHLLAHARHILLHACCQQMKISTILQKALLLSVSLLPCFSNSLAWRQAQVGELPGTWADAVHSFLRLALTAQSGFKLLDAGLASAHVERVCVQCSDHVVC